MNVRKELGYSGTAAHSVSEARILNEPFNEIMKWPRRLLPSLDTDLFALKCRILLPRANLKNRGDTV